jgi:hypothetical protein
MADPIAINGTATSVPTHPLPTVTFVVVQSRPPLQHPIVITGLVLAILSFLLGLWLLVWFLRNRRAMGRGPRRPSRQVAEYPR